MYRWIVLFDVIKDFEAIKLVFLVGSRFPLLFAAGLVLSMGELVKILGTAPLLVLLQP